jgi:hypothetical protein
MIMLGKRKCCVDTRTALRLQCEGPVRRWLSMNGTRADVGTKDMKVSIAQVGSVVRDRDT